MEAELAECKEAKKAVKARAKQAKRDAESAKYTITELLGSAAELREAGRDDAAVVQELFAAKKAFQAAADRHRAADAETRHVDARHKYLFKLLVARFQAADVEVG